MLSSPSLLSILSLLVALPLVSAACSAKPPAEASTPPAPPATIAPEPAPTAAAAPAPTANETTAAADAAIERAVAAPDRSAEDRELDEGRHPAELLKFFQIAPGQRVAELAAGKGYTAELLARVVGQEGRIYAQNSRFILEKFAEGPWSERLKSPVMTPVVRVDREFDAPLPEEATNLDAVLLVLFYHDTVWFETDRPAMNRAIYDALRPGGVYGIVDHSARPGDGIKEAKTLHRIEESVLRKEVEDAGFVLEAEADFLRNPDDTRDWNAAPSAAADRRGTSDRFVFRFRKPLSAEGSQPSDGAASGSNEGSTNDDAFSKCTEPRHPMCTREYRPVCADVDTGVRCVTTPCPSTEKKTYPNACTACADEKVIGHRPGACP